MSTPNIDISKRNESVNHNDLLNSSKLDSMSLAMRDICNSLNVKSNLFESKNTFLKIIKYVKTYERLLYGDISAYCFSLEQEEMDSFNGNLIQLVMFTDSEGFSKTVEEIKQTGNKDDVELCEKTKRIIIKMYDHVNLASVQLSDLKKDDKELERKVNSKLIPVKEEITREMSSQLIALVAIFTAVAFVVFGGFSSLSSIFSNIKEVPEKLIMIVSVWGLAICNTIFILMYSIGHLLRNNKTEITASSLIPTNLVKWTNLILCSIGAISTWLYFIGVNGIGMWFVNFSQMHAKCVSLLGVAIIITFTVVLSIFMFKKKNNSSKKDE